MPERPSALSASKLRWGILLVGFCLMLYSAAASGEPASRAGGEREREPKLEFGIFPLLGGSTDRGFGGGALVALSRIHPEVAPYLWRLQGGAAATFRAAESGGLEIGYLDVYGEFNVPEFVDDRTRFVIQPAFTVESAELYYGIGNATEAPEDGPEGQSHRDFFEFEWTHPNLWLEIRRRVHGNVHLLLGNHLTYTRLSFGRDSKLGRDLADPRLSSKFFGPLGPHWLNVVVPGVAYDSRDNEIDPEQGMYHQLALRVSPGGGSVFPYAYVQPGLSLRFYESVVKRWLVLAWRLVFDAQIGRPPFYEMARYEATSAVGGSSGVRGVPARRYYGKVKVFGNLETRHELWRFRLGDKRYALGVATFFDAGRVWSDFSPDVALDGRGLGLKYGTGGGLRFQQGKTFVVRADVAWSPDATPISAYVRAGHIF